MLREDVITAASWHWRRWLKREQLLQTRDILLVWGKSPCSRTRVKGKPPLNYIVTTLTLYDDYRNCIDHKSIFYDTCYIF
ncbi:hypothetical protein QTP88_026527 [Uroleucon formosanum]